MITAGEFIDAVAIGAYLGMLGLSLAMIAAGAYLYGRGRGRHG